MGSLRRLLHLWQVFRTAHAPHHISFVMPHHIAVDGFWETSLPRQPEELTFIWSSGHVTAATGPLFMRPLRDMFFHRQAFKADGKALDLRFFSLFLCEGIMVLVLLVNHFNSLSI